MEKSGSDVRNVHALGRNLWNRISPVGEVERAHHTFAMLRPRTQQDTNTDDLMRKNKKR